MPTIKYLKSPKNGLKLIIADNQHILGKNKYIHDQRPKKHKR